MWNRLLAHYDSVRNGVNNGLIAGGLIVFLITLGLPAALQGREPLAPLSLPIFLLIMIIFGVRYVRQAGQNTSWPKLIQNGIAYGIAVAVVFLLFMGLINRWQANPNIEVKSYFEEINLNTTSRLSGVPVEELGPNPPRNPLTGDYAEDAVVRTNPMRLTLNNEDIAVINLFGIFQLGGLYGSALIFAIMGLLSIIIYRLLQYLDWEMLRNRWSAILQRPAISESLHWARLLLPLGLFSLFLLTVNMNYDTSFWRNMPLFSGFQDKRALLNTKDVFGLSARATQNFQLMLVFATIIAFMVAMRAVRYHKSRLPYPIRLTLLSAVIVSVFGLSIWRIVGSDVSFISPTLPILPHDPQTMSSILVLIIAGIAGIYAIFVATNDYTFETTLVGISGILMMLAMPLFMDQYQTSVLNLVAINIMLGLGLNIVVGYAGLLDLGYVAFFGIGAYTYALIASNRQQLEISQANDIFFTFLTAVVVVPIVVFSTLYLWRGSQSKNTTEEQVDPSKPRRMKPTFAGGPPLPVSIALVIFAIVVALGSTWLLRSLGVFDGVYRASPFILGLIFAVLASAGMGVILGFPVLRLRSDYLAIVTLGFGEIISVILENWEGVTGGAFGADGIPKPLPSGASVAESNLAILYLGILGSALIAFLSMRLRASRLGRSWTALRSDEDIAQAMGVNLVNAKLLAFMIGASFAGASGLLFAARQANIRPANFNLNISINVLALVIIGGIGSIPGIVIGGIVLVGLPEMLRALSDYRYLVFGALLVVTMLVRPEGLLPKPIVTLEERARQLRGDNDTEASHD